MSLFEFTFGLSAVILGLALAHMASTVSRLALAGGRVRWAPEPLLLAAIIVLVIITVWLDQWWARDRTSTTIGLMLIQVGKLMLPFMAATFVLPDPVPDEGPIDLYAHYDRTRALTYGTLIVGMLAFWGAELLTWANTANPRLPMTPWTVVQSSPWAFCLFYALLSSCAGAGSASSCWGRGWSITAGEPCRCGWRRREAKEEGVGLRFRERSSAYLQPSGMSSTRVTTGPTVSLCMATLEPCVAFCPVTPIPQMETAVSIMRLHSTLLPLVIAVIVLMAGPARAQTLEADPAQVALWQEAARAYDTGDAEAAEPLFRRFVEAARAEPNPVDVMNGLARLGLILSALERYEEAEATLTETATLMQADLATNRADIATILNELGSVHQARGAFQPAETAFREALRIRRTYLGFEEPETLASLNNLAVLLIKTGAYAEAERLAREATDGYTARPGPRSAEVAQTLNTLGSALLRSGRYPEAETTLREALSIQIETLGPDALMTSYTRNNLALLLDLEGRKAEAEAEQRLAAAGFERTLGSDHPATLTARSNLAALLVEREAPQAAAMAVALLADRTRVLGPDHPDTAVSQAQVAVILEREGHYDGAETYMLSSIRSQIATHGNRSPIVAEGLHMLVGLLLGQRKYDEAESFARTGLQIRTAALGPQHADTAASALQLGQVLEGRRVYGEARAFYASALTTYLAAWCEPDGQRAGWGSAACPGHPDMTQAAVNVARMDLNHVARPAAATRRAALASDMTVGRTRARYARDPEGRAEFDRFRMTHAGFVTAAWTTSHP